MLKLPLLGMVVPVFTNPVNGQIEEVGQSSGGGGGGGGPVTQATNPWVISSTQLATLLTLIGEVQASPTTNTLLARLKEIQDLLVSLPTTTTIADGADVAQGDRDDAAYGGAGASTIVSALKGIYARVDEALAESVFTGRLGEVQATPTANTLLGRLKDIDDEVALRLAEATFTARFGEVDAAPTANTLLARLKAIGDFLDGLLDAVPRTSGGVELFTTTTPGQVTQAALEVGVDEVAAPLIIPKTTNVTASGETILVDPGAGKKIRLWSVKYSVRTATAVRASLRAGTGGTDQFQIQCPAAVGALLGHNIKPNYWDLAADQNLYANLSGAADINVLIEYQEI